MIVSIKYKVLQLNWKKGDKSKLPALLVGKIERLLVIIDTLEVVPLDLKTFVILNPHPLKAGLKGYWSFIVTGNWRIIFRFDNSTSTTHDLDFLDSH